MPTRHVELTDHQEALVGSLVESGRYQDVGEVLREGLRLVEQREAEDAARLDALRQAVDSGIRDIDEGRFDLLSTRSQIAAYIDEIDASRATVPASPRKYVYCPRNSWDGPLAPLPDWDAVAQPAPEFEFDQRISW
jgi:antitoxin ParD1/3/4